MVKIRVMTIADYDGVCDVWNILDGTNPVDDSLKGFTKYLKRNPTTSFIAEENGNIVGTILAGHDGRRGFFHHVAVLPEYQKLGVGRMLADSAMNALEKEGINKVALVVFADNENGNGFWEHIGFTVRNDLVYRNKYTGGSN